MEITANELRLGNIIRYKDNDKIVPAFRGKTRVIDITALRLIYETKADYYEPIPLTEEILLKAGAKELKHDEELEDHYHFKIDHYTFYICIDKGEGYANEGNALFLIHGVPYTSFTCKYVHQLQNLIFALCGQELEINL